MLTREPQHRHRDSVDLPCQKDKPLGHMKFVSTSPAELDEKYYQWFAFGSFAYCSHSNLAGFPYKTDL